MLTPGLPDDLDDESLRRIARSFYVVRMTRYAGLLAATAAMGTLAVVRGAPSWVVWTVGLLALLLLVGMALTRRRYVSSQRPASPAPASRSPRGRSRPR